MQLHKVVGKIAAKQLHQAFDLVRRALPVLGGKGIERQRINPERWARLDDLFDLRRAALVADQPCQPAPRRPAAVAVHDNSNVHLLFLDYWRLFLRLCLLAVSGQPVNILAKFLQMHRGKTAARCRPGILGVNRR